MIFVLVVLVATLVVLIFDLLAIDVVGIGLLLLLALGRVLPPDDVIAGFSNRAVLTIAALFMVSEGILRTGAIGFLARRLIGLSGGNYRRLLLLTVISVGTVSMFLNNTPVVIMFLPLILGIASEERIFPSKLLIPLSFGTMLGGLCTLIGTSTNVVASAVAEAQGQPPIGMFELTALGLLFFAAGTIYLVTIGHRLLPEHRTLTTQAPGGSLREFVTEVEVLWGSEAVGKKVKKVFPQRNPLVLSLVRGEEMIWPPFEGIAVGEGDLFILQGTVNDIASLERKEGMRILPGLVDGRLRFEPKTMSFVELVVRPDSPCVGARVRDLGLRRRADLVPIALMRGGRHIRAKISDLVLRPGDVLLAFGSEEGIREVSVAQDFFLLEGIHETFVNRRRAPIAGAILAAVVVALSTRYVPMEMAAMGGAFLMVLTGCLAPNQAYRSVSWPILILLVGTLALGRALEVTGAAGHLAGPLVAVGEHFGPWAAVSALYLATSVVTAFLSNNATAVFLVPIGLSLATSLGVDPRPFIMAITFAASADFATPIGYQTNLIVYGPGGYRFGDFFKIGAPLTLLLWIVASIFIPILWPF